MTYFKSLDKEKVRKVLEEYKTQHGEYPTTGELKKLYSKSFGIIPSVKWIQKKGGIIPFYQSLGLNYTDARTGARRSNTATLANKRSQSIDIQFSEKLVSIFGESNVHWQSPYNKGKTLHRSDFRVYKKDGTSFFVDLFFPQDIHSFQGCISIKLRKVIPLAIHEPILFICCNEHGVSAFDIKQLAKTRKIPLPKNIHILHISEVDFSTQF